MRLDDIILPKYYTYKSILFQILLHYLHIRRRIDICVTSLFSGLTTLARKEQYRIIIHQRNGLLDGFHPVGDDFVFAACSLNVFCYLAANLVYVLFAIVLFCNYAVITVLAGYGAGFLSARQSLEPRAPEYDYDLLIIKLILHGLEEPLIAELVVSIIHYGQSLLVLAVKDLHAPG